MYYLQSRYYDPQIARFINADEPSMFQWDGSIVLGAFTYANNSSVMFMDSTGYSAIVAVAGGVTVSLGAAVAYLSTAFAGICGLALLFNTKTRRKAKDALTIVWERTESFVGYLETAISEALAEARRSRWYFGKDLHHIVAKADVRAESSREILRDNGLTHHGAYNLVKVKKTLHKHLHTSAYHYGVYLVLSFAAAMTSKKSEKKYYILAALVLIGALLTAASNAL